jgi:hypothetical protein
MNFTLNDYFTNLSERLKDRRVAPEEKATIRLMLGV